MLLLYILLGLFFLFTIGIFLFIKIAAPSLPEDIDALIQQVQSEEIPEFIHGKVGKAPNGSLHINYESIGNPTSSKGTIILICGHTQIMLDWPKYFYQPLVEAGYHVIRFDNRGIGWSSWVKNWTKQNAFTLEDMATDIIAILDHLHIPKAHIIGMSMGGMIGQRLAISHTNRVHSLTSIMSTGFYNDPTLGGIPKDFYRKLIALILKYPIWSKKEVTQLKLNLAVRRLLVGKGPYELDSKYTLQKAFYEIRKRRGYNKKATNQHSMAITKSGSRYEELKQINVPTLVIHGKTDPLVKFSHAQKYAPMIPNVETLFIEGMGHDLPEIYINQMIGRILKIMK